MAEPRWQPPDELRRPGPRPVRLTGKGVTLLVVGLFFVVLGPGMAIFTSSQIQKTTEREQLLAQQGADATATVVRLWRRNDKNHTAMVSYRFSTGPEVIDSQSLITDSGWKALREGDTLPIRYLPSNPTISRPSKVVPGPPPYWVPLLPLAAFGVAPLVFTILIRRQKRLLTNGIPAPATVTKTRRGKQLQVFYDFKLPSGEVIHGKSSADFLAAPEIGARISILYDPDNPSRSGVYPLELVKLRDAG